MARLTELLNLELDLPGAGEEARAAHRRNLAKIDAWAATVVPLPTFDAEDDDGKTYGLKIVEGVATWVVIDAVLLPAVTVADNGKVAKVAAGVWAAGTDAT